MKVGAALAAVSTTPSIEVTLTNPPSAPDPTWTILGAVVAATLGAIIAQLLAHRLTRVREDQTAYAEGFDRAVGLSYRLLRGVTDLRASYFGYTSTLDQRRSDALREIEAASTELRAGLLATGLRAGRGRTSLRHLSGCVDVAEAAIKLEERSDISYYEIADLIPAEADRIRMMIAEAVLVAERESRGRRLFRSRAGS